MGNRRYALISSSDSEEEEEKSRAQRQQKKRKTKRKAKESDEESDEENSEGSDEEEAAQEDAKPIGEVVEVTGKGKNRKKHYRSFEYDGNRFELEDPVLLTPEDTTQKPYVAIIKDITQSTDGSMSVTGQWFYRPEEAAKKGGGSWQATDTRELFYSFHRDEVPAESVMHKCVVHFIPLNKQIPRRKEHPGFIVQRVYDTVHQRLWKLTDKDYEDIKQDEIDLLVGKTRERLGEIPDIETEEVIGDQEIQLKKRILRRKNMAPLDVTREVTREDDVANRSDQHLPLDTPGSCTGEVTGSYIILVNFDALTGDTVRDKWLEKLLQGVQFVCDSKENTIVDSKDKGESTTVAHHTKEEKCSEGPDTSQLSKVGRTIIWPDDAVRAVVALEKASHDAFSADFQKYNQKMRQLLFNLKQSNAVLARRLVNGELEASAIPHMSPNELKEGLMASEVATKEPEQAERMQMTDARCRRCMEKKVGVTDIIQAGGRGDRYQLECIACGNTWYASRDEVSTLTIEAPNTTSNVGTVPLATAKFEDVEKLTSPRESPASDILKKTTAAYMPTLETQKSFKQKVEEPSGANAE
ncbi:hypothetical protein Syun_018079 [Stephania yunnanensis]|uniref:Uncharacterized protein n=1 Tax=Stephania yunnanensis TaxID=152371 RepID=A0AAP0IRL4_9MAGN